MAAKGVNLDALIPREDLSVGDGLQSGAQGDPTIGDAHLRRGFFRQSLRKPDFQRETTQWSPAKVVELVEAYLDRRLIPAVILWKAGNHNFVIDGAHRLSALLAWMQDDYGDGDASKALFGSNIDPEQRAMADKTRALMDKNVGKYALFEASLTYPQVVNDIQKVRIGNLSVSHFVAQWVPAATSEAAEKSFFTINANATPLEATEKKILQSRRAGNSVAARAIAHAGAGYAYWKDFDEETQGKIVALGKDIYEMLYRPPLSQGAIDTLDVTVAGRGYSVLPFVFDLINFASQTRVGDSSKPTAQNKMPPDDTGQDTLDYLSAAFRSLSRITGKRATSLGLHPVVYFYTRGGAFQPWAFLAWSKIVDDLFEQQKVNEFCEARAAVEEFLISHKAAMTAIVHQYGSGNRSIAPLTKFWSFLLAAFMGGADGDAALEIWRKSDDWSYLLKGDPLLRLPDDASKKRISRTTLTATIWDAALPGAPRCAICYARLHRNSTTGEHLTAKRDGGDSRPENAGISHPYCNSTYKDWKAKRA